MASTRGLNSDFMDDLQPGGFMNPLLEVAKADDTLSLNIRRDYVNIYYRGGNLLRITRARSGDYEFRFDSNYCKVPRTGLGSLPMAQCAALPTAVPRGQANAVDLWVAHIPLLKSAMDVWQGRKGHKFEREFQQLTERANNWNKHTDYYIVDIEYTGSDFRELRADMVALRWPHTKEARSATSGFRPRLTLIEMKHGDSALTDDAGLVGHVRTMLGAVQMGSLNLGQVAAEALAVFRQRVQLGLIDCDGKGSQFCGVDGVEEDAVDYVVVVADHAPRSSVLKRELAKVQQLMGAQASPPFSVKGATASPMGFGLFASHVVPLPQFLALLP